MTREKTDYFAGNSTYNKVNVDRLKKNTILDGMEGGKISRNIPSIHEAIVKSISSYDKAKCNR